MKKFDVVVFEDLDRFGGSEIFVKLREINKLINDNRATGGNIKFLYAIKDDMFIHRDRTKFFDFIIPVVPVINRHNSLEKMSDRLAVLNVQSEIDDIFLREVALYLDDLRLVNNIFNEFLLYWDRLQSDQLSATKLLAIIIYKNSYPTDFELLHSSKGAFYEICLSRSQTIQLLRSQLEDKIGEVKSLIQEAEAERATSINELMSSYLWKIVSYTQSNATVTGIMVGRERYKFSEMLNIDKFSELMKEQNIHLCNDRQNQQFSTGKSFATIENEIEPNSRFLERKSRIERKGKEKSKSLRDHIRGYERDIEELVHLSLSSILKKSDTHLKEIIGRQTRDEDWSLLVYLVKNGYLDDSYTMYISNFYEGRLSSKDRDFLLTVRNAGTHDANQQVDNPHEVCINLREEDFSNIYCSSSDLI